MASMAQAIRMALHYGEKHLDVKDIFGEDVGAPLGGVFTCTQGLETTWNTPLDERGIIGCAMGVALTGDRCVAEIQFCDYIFNTIDLLKLVGNTYWSTNGLFNLPLVIMTPVGAGIHGSIYHSHSFDAIATRLPGFKVVMPSNAKDAYGLLLAAIKDPNPVLYLKPKALMRVKGKELLAGEPESDRELKAMIDAPVGDRSKWKANWPELEDESVELGKAKTVIEGDQVTVVTYGRHVLECEVAIKEVQSQGVSVELIDLRTLYPYDWPCIQKSIEKTGRVIFVNEDTEVTNFAEHLVYRTTQELFYHLLARPRVLAGKNLPGIGLSPALEYASVPMKADIVNEILDVVKELP
ncbi:MAG: alpha-ketoacid dehydrogenase subunit beta [Bdellovibrionaceae bacterium]|jgi:2-oxoisovalerate dehydrogenase E1 component beta subunit|nr:alpha-ketoacid dehydrogenase subunit beta [Pseudobdellovibrionaceae bacterium]